jgi:chemotaxis protein methyltransferase CheR
MPIIENRVEAICRVVEDLCGIVLNESKSYLLENRLANLLKREGVSNFDELASRVHGPSSSLAVEIIDAMTTNETLFFRDNSPFEAFQYKVLPELVDARSVHGRVPTLRIWSAACSTGQEAYSLAMAIKRTIPCLSSVKISILGTDISQSCIAQARNGVYQDHEISRGLDTGLQSSFFKRCEDGWRICDEIRNMVKFEQRNLLQPFTALGTFDIIFCRNVVIYFSAEVRRSVFHRLADALTPDGALFVGSTESLADLGPNFQPQHHCRSVFYQPNGLTSMSRSL